MNTLVEFGGQDRHYQIKQAILVYEDAASSAAAATVHAVELLPSRGSANSRPIIQPGQPITILALETLIQSLGRGAKGGFIPPNIISLAMDGMVWWCPAARRRIWFKPSNDTDAKRLKALNGKSVHHPPLLFKAENNGLNAYALVKNERPTPDIRVYRAPYWNLSDGHMCNGNLKLPPVAPENLAAFEAAFFGSAFTHSSDGTLTSYPGGHTSLWEHLASRKTAPDARFWTAHLRRTDNTVSQILK